MQAADDLNTATDREEQVNDGQGLTSPLLPSPGEAQQQQQQPK